jgi:hypothetical protein
MVSGMAMAGWHLKLLPTTLDTVAMRAYLP